MADARGMIPQQPLVLSVLWVVTINQAAIHLSPVSFHLWPSILSFVQKLLTSTVSVRKCLSKQQVPSQPQALPWASLSSCNIWHFIPQVIYQCLFHNCWMSMVLTIGTHRSARLILAVKKILKPVYIQAFSASQKTQTDQLVKFWVHHFTK